MNQTEQTFIALIREATFTKEVLGAGATQIRKANYAAHGVYAQSFAALSIGLERIGKLCLMLDHYIDHGGKFPDFRYLKNQIGHELSVLHSRGQQISQRRQIKFRFLPSLDHPLHNSILQVLNSYANGDRYSNINILVRAKQQDDPIALWSKLVDSQIYETLVSDQRKRQIAQKATAAGGLMDNASVFHIAETGELIQHLTDASSRTGMFEAVAPYRQLYVLQMIRYWVELLWELGSLAQSLGRQEIPFFAEILGGFCNDDSYFRSRKTWLF